MKTLLVVLILVVIVLAICLALVIEECKNNIVAAIKDASVSNALSGSFKNTLQQSQSSPDPYLKMFENPNTVGTLRRGDLPVDDPRVTGRASPTLEDIQTARRNQAHTHGDDES